MDLPYLPSAGESTVITPNDALLPKSMSEPEQVRIEARWDPEWEHVVGAPAVSIHAKQPQTGRIHERRRAAPLPPRIEAPWMMSHYEQHGIQLNGFGQVKTHPGDA